MGPTNRRRGPAAELSSAAIRLCLAIRLLTSVFCLLLSFTAFAGEPAWWTQQKIDCGLSISLAYNDWVAQGMPCTSASNGNRAPATPTKQELEAKDLQEASDDENDKGVDRFKQRNWDDAIKHFTAALDYNPGNDDAIANLARARLEAGKELAAQERASQTAKRKAVETSQVAAILRGLSAIKVPPPIPAEDAALTFGQLAPEDHASRNIILGTEVGIAVIDVFGRIQNHPLNLTPTKLVFVVGNTFIAAENAADVYIVRHNDSCEKALRYLKDDATRQNFTTVVRALKEGRPIAEDASIEMVRAAQAILDPKLGNSGRRIAWDAMLSLEARHAALTAVCIELLGEILGQASEKAVARLSVQRLPAFTEATEYLSKATAALGHVSDPAARGSLKTAIKQANEMIAQSYQLVSPGATAMEHIVSIFSSQTEEEYREKK